MNESNVVFVRKVLVIYSIRPGQGISLPPKHFVNEIVLRSICLIEMLLHLE